MKMAEVRIIFWNVGERDRTNLVCALADENKADIVVLNENEVPIDVTLAALQRQVSGQFTKPHHQPSNRFHCFSRDPSFNLTEAHCGDRMSVRHLHIAKRRFLLALVHCVDVRSNDATHRQEFAHLFAAEVRFVQEQQKTRGIILLGDFNMNPYDPVMNLPTGFNAMMTRQCVEPGVRGYREKNYDLYYNPMWGLFGDNTAGPPGTIYDRSRQGPFGWSMFDQVLFHYSTVGLFRNVRILDRTRSLQLTRGNGRPDDTVASDHLPILVTLQGNADE